MSQSRPSGWWYILGIVLTFGGCGASLGLTVWQTSGKVDRMQRMIMPGEHEVALETGSHLIYAELRSTVGGTTYVWQGGSMKCAVVEIAGNHEVALEAATVKENYSFGSFEGQSMFQFEVATAGPHRVTCEVEGGGPMTIAINQGRVLGGMFYSMLAGFLVAAAGLTMILLTWDKRRKQRPT